MFYMLEKLSRITFVTHIDVCFGQRSNHLHSIAGDFAVGLPFAFRDHKAKWLFLLRNAFTHSLLFVQLRKILIFPFKQVFTTKDTSYMKI